MASEPAVYWDASALVSTLVTDDHSRDARRRKAEERVRLVSSLAYAEVCATMATIERRTSAPGLVVAAAADLRSTSWTPVTALPDGDIVERLAGRWPLLRGADLWHLSTALTLQQEGAATLELLTFDGRLREAAVGEGLAA